MNRHDAGSSFSPTLVWRMFALRRIQPFDRIAPDELTLIAEMARPRAYPGGAPLHSGALPLGRLIVVVGGAVVDAAGRPAGPILGADSLVRRRPVPQLLASPGEGACTLEIGRRHFFTLARECPEFVLGLLELGAQGAVAETK